MRESALSSPLRRSVAIALTGAVFFSISPLPTAIARPAPDRVSGRATVIDGDTLEIDGARVRLEGIDAPESSQTCGRRLVGWWNCGSAAANALEKLVEGHRIDCKSQGHDRYSRLLAVCFADGRDINAAMVRQGFAWAFVKYSKSYVEAESEARTARAGIWQGNAEPAWIYREKRWQTAEVAAPNGCAIKGNVTGHGQIYHLPWSPWYGKVKVDAARGERWFCSEADAQKAGWRPAMTP